MKKMPLKKFVQGELVFIALLVLVNLLLGVWISTDYGIGLDEAGDVQYGIDALDSYRSNERNWEWYGTRKYYGPAYLMTQEWLTSRLSKVFPAWGAVGIRHFIIFAAFQISIVAFYLFLRRLFSQATTLTVTLLFALQPLYFGHAFINGKDIPFMAFFLLTIVLGILASDRLLAWMGKSEEQTAALYPALFSVARRDWENLNRKQRGILLAMVILPLLLAIELYATQLILVPTLRNSVYSLYNQQAWEPLNQLFVRIAQNSGSIPPSAYADKAVKLVLRVSSFLYLSYLPVLIYAGLRSFRQTGGLLWEDVRSFPVRALPRSAFLPILLLAAIVMGLTTSIRIVGFLAGFLISLIFILRHRGKAVLLLVIYWSAGFLITYVSWPYLWGEPIARLQESLAIMTNHPWRGYVLYMGEVTKGRLLPWHFLPNLMLVQFSEPVWILFGLSIPGLFARQVRKHLPLWIAIVLVIWYLLPVGPMSVREVWLYDNFRQFLFVTPVIFVFGALGLEWVFQSVRSPILKGLAALVVVLPGMLGIIHLHPYQYIYYNSFAGGIAGAAGRFELDYWCTSYTEAMKELNDILPPQAVVGFRGSVSAAEPYSRPDITLIRITAEEDLQHSNPDVAVVCSRADTYETFLSNYPLFAEIKLQNVPLSVVRKISP